MSAFSQAAFGKDTAFSSAAFSFDTTIVLSNDAVSVSGTDITVTATSSGDLTGGPRFGVEYKSGTGGAAGGDAVHVTGQVSSQSITIGALDGISDGYWSLRDYYNLDPLDPVATRVYGASFIVLVDTSPTPTPTPTPTTFGQQPWLVARAPQRTREDVHKSRVLHGIEEKIVHAVALRQAEQLDLDELQRKEELLAELNLAKIEARAVHFEELSRQRQALIDEEIARRLHEIMQADEDAIAMMIMLAATL